MIPIDRIRRPLLRAAADVLGKPALPRPAVRITDPVKGRIFVDWYRNGVPEKDLAAMFGLRREHVELVLHEVCLALLEFEPHPDDAIACSGPVSPPLPAAAPSTHPVGELRRAA